MTHSFFRFSFVCKILCVFWMVGLWACSAGKSGGAETDHQPPTVKSIIPEDGSVDVARDIAIEILFSEEIKESTISLASVRLVSVADEGTVGTSLSYHAASKVLTVTPTVLLAPYAEYILFLEKEITDIVGNAFEPAEYSFRTLDNVAPAAPSQISDDGLYSDIVDVTFAWLAGIDQGSGIASYVLQVGTSPGANDVLDQDVGDVLSYVATGLQGETLYARVSSIDNAGLQSGWSANTDGITIDTTVPGTPGIPEAGIEYSSSTDVEFTWTPATDAESGIALYYLEVGTTEGSSNVFAGDVGNSLSHTVTGVHGTTVYAQVSAYNGAGIQGTFSDSSAGVLIDTTAPSTPGIPDAGGAVTGSTSVTFSWNPSIDNESGVASYVLKVGTVIGGTNVFDQNVGDVLSYTVTGNNGDTLYASVAAINRAGLQGNTATDTNGITINTNYPGTIAAAPQDGGASSSGNVTFTWDSSANATSYRLRIGTLKGASDVLDEDVGNVQSYVYAGTHGQTVYARVAGVNAVGQGPWSLDSDGILIDTTAPAAPSSLTDSGEYSTQTGLTFSWDEVIDSESGVVSYLLQVGSTEGDTEIFNENVGNVLTYEITGTDGQMHYARVAAINGAGLQSDFSESTDGIFVDTTKPSTPGIPDDGGALTGSTTVIFSWTPAADAQSGVASYDLQIGTSVGGTDLFDGNVGDGLSYSIVGESGTTLYARVRAMNHAGLLSTYSDWSDGITIDTNYPGGVAAPTDNGMYIASTDVTFNWDASANATSYSLQIGTTPNGSDLLDQNVGDVQTYVYTAVHGQTVYARVAGVNALGQGPWSAGSNGILIDTTAPPTPEAPVDAGSFVNALTVPFDWALVVDPESGVVSYVLEVGTTPGDNDVFGQDVGNVTSYEVTGAQGQTLYAQVAAVNAAGTQGDFSANSDGVVLDTTAPSTLSAPTDAGVYIPSTTVSFSWDAASDASSGIASYVLEIGTSADASDVFADDVGNVLTYDIAGTHGVTYFARIAAINGASIQADFSPSSNGVMVDTTEPSPPSAPTDAGSYSTNATVNFAWTAGNDAESGVASYYVEVGTTPTGSDVFSGNVGNVLNYNATGNNGDTLYARVASVNGAGTQGALSGASDGIVIDITAPGIPGVPADMGDYSPSTTVTFTWTAATDPESSVASYFLQVGTTVGSNNIFSGNVGNVLTYDVTGSDTETLYARVAAVNTAGTQGAYSGDSDGILIDATPPTTPGVPTDPGTYSTSRTVTFGWTAAADGETDIAFYTLEVGTSAGASDVFSQNIGNVVTYDVTCPQGETVYARVAATNNAGAQGTFSGNSNGILIDINAPSIPGAPTDPGDYGTSTTITFSWVAADDPESGIASYHLKAGTAPGGTDLFDADVGDVLTQDVTGVSGEMAYASVAAINNAGLQSGFSPPSDGILIDATAPAAPAAPTDDGAYASSTSVQFNWMPGSDPESGIASYYVEVGSAAGQNDIFSGNVGNVLSYVGTGTNGQELFARVAAVNRAGTQGTFSTSSDGITIDTTMPSSPGTPTDAGAQTDNATVTFNWTAAADAESAIASYVLEVGTTAGASDIFVGDVGNVLTYDVTGTDNQTLYARVMAINGAGNNSNYSGNSDGILVDTLAPSKPGTPTDAGAYSSSTTLSFDWTSATDSASGVASYVLRVGTTAGGNDILEQNVGNVLSYGSVTGTDGQTHYAQVAAVDNVGRQGAFSDASDGILVDTTAPSAPGQPVDGGTTSGSTSVMFTWTEATDAESGVTSYEVRVGTTVGGNEIFEGSVGSALAYNATGSNGQTLYAKVRATNGANLTGNYSADSDGITINTNFPGGVAAPTDDGAATSNTTVTFSWGNSSNADYYYLQIGTTPDGSDILDDGNVGLVQTYDYVGSHGQTVYARVAGVNAVGQGPWSASSDGITIDTTAPSVPGTPTDQGTLSPATATFSWTAATDAESGIASYVLTVGTSPGNFDVFNADVGNVLSYGVDVSGNHEQNVYAKVYAVNGAGLTSAYSGDSDGIEVDGYAPSIEGTSPSDQVWPANDLVIRFNEQMDTASVEAAIGLTDSLGSPPKNGYVTYWNDGNSEITIIPDTTDPVGTNNSDILEPGESYALDISSTATDIAGNPLDTRYTWNFTVVDTAPPGLVSILTASGVNLLEEAAPAGEIQGGDTLRFIYDQEMDQTYGKIRSYDDELEFNVEMHNHELISASGDGSLATYQTNGSNKLESGMIVSIIGITPSSLNVTDEPITVVNEETFTIPSTSTDTATAFGQVIFCESEDGDRLAWTDLAELTLTLGSDRMISAGIESDLWTEARNKDSVYSNQSEYLVQVAGDSSVDTYSPDVVSTNPLDLATNVKRFWPIRLMFDEPIVHSTLNDIIITGGGISMSDFVIHYDRDMGTRIILMPTRILPASTTFAVTIPTSIEDLAGNTMAAPYIFSFTTAADGDAGAPQVQDTLPFDGSVSGNRYDVELNFVDSSTGLFEALDPATFDLDDILITNTTTNRPQRGWTLQSDTGILQLASPRGADGIGPRWTCDGLSSVTGDGATATYTTSQDHTIQVGQEVHVYSVNDPAFDFELAEVTSVPDARNFCVSSTVVGSSINGNVCWEQTRAFTVQVGLGGASLADFSGNFLAESVFSFTASGAGNRDPMLRSLDNARVQGSSSASARSLDVRLEITEPDKDDPVDIHVTDGLVDGVDFTESFDAASDSDWEYGPDGPASEAEPGMDDTNYPTSGYYTYTITLSDPSAASAVYTRDAWVWAPSDVPVVHSVDGNLVNSTEPLLVVNPTPLFQWTPGDAANADEFVFLAADVALMSGGDGPGSGGTYAFMQALNPAETTCSITPQYALPVGIYIWVIAQSKMGGVYGQEVGLAWGVDFSSETTDAMFVYGPDNDLLAYSEYGVASLSVETVATPDDAQQRQGERGTEFGGASGRSGELVFGTTTVASLSVTDHMGATTSTAEFFGYGEADAALVLTHEDPGILGRGVFGRGGEFFATVQSTNWTQPFLNVGTHRYATSGFTDSSLDGDWVMVQIQVDGADDYVDSFGLIGELTLSNGSATFVGTDHDGTSFSTSPTYSVESNGEITDWDLDGTGSGTRTLGGFVGGAADAQMIALAANAEPSTAGVLTWQFMARAFDLTGQDNSLLSGTYQLVMLSIEEDTDLFSNATTAYGTATFYGDGTFDLHVRSGEQIQNEAVTYVVDPPSNRVYLGSDTEIVVGPDANTLFGLEIGNSNRVRLLILSK